jgi:fusaric acid resistance family protein
MREVGLPEIVTASLGLALPVAIGAATGHVAAGMGAALGALALGDAGAGATRVERMGNVAHAFVAAIAAVLAGTLAARGGAAGAVLLVLLAGGASLIGGMSRPLALATPRFVVFLVIVSHTARRGSAWEGIVLFAAGALWAAALALALAGLRRPDAAAAPQRASTFAQRWRRWRGLLATHEGWAFAIQVTACLGVAEAIAVAWPRHHTYWIALTAALVLRRQRSELHERAFERAAGTAVGVVVGGLLLAWPLPAWALIVAIAAIAAARPVLRERSYLGYSVVMTPLIVMLMDFGRPATPMLMADRLLATLAGCLLAVAAARWLAPRR